MAVTPESADPLALDDIPDAASLMHVAVERLFRLLKGQMAAALESRGSSIVEWRILLMLRIHGEMPQKDLVREVAMVQAQVSRALEAMRRRGLVSAERSDRDRRVWLFALTPEGTDLYRSTAPVLADRKALLDTALAPEEVESFLAAARKLAAVAAAQPEGPRAAQASPIAFDEGG